MQVECRHLPHGRRPPAVPDGVEQLRFLQSSAAHAAHTGQRHRVRTIETHMSWVFLVGDHALKLKKPVRQPYLDFSTLASREFHCREELRLNARLAPGVYLGLCVLHWDGHALALVPEAARPCGGEILDWLVLMRRLPHERMLDVLIRQGTAQEADIAALGERLLDFYRRVPRLTVSGALYRAHFEREQALNRELLLHAGFAWRGAGAALDRLDAALRREGELLDERARREHVVDGHGDLRPEHVCLLHPPVVIDALEFNAALRRVDPLDEIACLGMECAAAGADWIGPLLVQRCAAALGDAGGTRLVPLYAASRALLRARLTAAHLLEPVVRRPRHWRPQAQRYIDVALRSLDALDA